MIRSYASEYPVLLLKTNKHDRAFAKIMTEEIVELVIEDRDLEYRHLDAAKSGIIFTVMIYPMGDYIAALYSNFVLNIICCDVGTIVRKTINLYE